MSKLLSLRTSLNKRQMNNKQNRRFMYTLTYLTQFGNSHPIINTHIICVLCMTRKPFMKFRLKSS